MRATLFQTFALTPLLLFSFPAGGQLLPNTWTEGCPSGAPPVHDKPIQGDDFVELQRTACFGTCPIYTVRLYGDGRLLWHGEKFVDALGDATGRVAPEQARAILVSAGKQGFWGLCGSYAARITDLPTVVTSVSLGGDVKRVSDYGRTAPQWLRDLDGQIDALVEGYAWRKAEGAEKIRPV